QRDSRDRNRRCASRQQPAQKRAAHRAGGDFFRVGPPLLARARSFSDGLVPSIQILAGGRTAEQRARRPKSDVLLPPGGELLRAVSCCRGTVEAWVRCLARGRNQIGSGPWSPRTAGRGAGWGTAVLSGKRPPLPCRGSQPRSSSPRGSL